MNPVSLEEMDSVKLMNRMDIKYLTHISNLQKIISASREAYQILEINNKRMMGYESLYFDTEDHRMYINHHNRKLNRYKIRIRQYLDSQDFFLEIKFKSNRGQTKKTRIPVSNYQAVESIDGASFIREKSIYNPVEILPKLVTTFNRITLVNKEKQERITIDSDLSFHIPGQAPTILSSLMVIELKTRRLAPSGGFKEILLSERIFEKKLSKYCTGTNLLYPHIKRNRFKPKLSYINKLENAYHYDQLYNSIV